MAGREIDKFEFGGAFEERIEMMLADIKNAENVVISGSLTDGGRYFNTIFHISNPGKYRYQGKNRTVKESRKKAFWK